LLRRGWIIGAPSKRRIKGGFVGYQDRFSNQQRRQRCSQKATKLDAVLLQDQALGP
jgi:hypothetical protein